MIFVILLNFRKMFNMNLMNCARANVFFHWIFLNSELLKSALRLIHVCHCILRWNFWKVHWRRLTDISKVYYLLNWTTLISQVLLAQCSKRLLNSLRRTRDCRTSTACSRSKSISHVIYVWHVHLRNSARQELNKCFCSRGKVPHVRGCDLGFLPGW